MNRTLLAILRGLLFCGVFAADLVAVSLPGPATAADGGAGDIHAGAISWSQNCARCHNMRDPTEFRDDLWKPIVTHMRVRAGLTGKQQRDILSFLQASNNPLPATTPADMTGEAAAAALSGEQVYNQTCVACHGVDGSGRMPGVPDFTAADGPLSKPDDILVRHILEGFRSPGSPMAMPPKGSNPDLTTADIRAVVGYLRTNFGR
ncbi:MAG: cytochrome c [Gammaproteobacteria bacterium]|jgi:cytochrome c5